MKEQERKNKETLSLSFKKIEWNQTQRLVGVQVQ